MLGLLLARSGVDVVVLEKHADFLRDFRGDTIHPSTLEILDQLGLAEDFLALGPNLAPVLRGQTPLGPVAIDFRRLPTRFPYLALIPQWDFLDFITERAARLPDFHQLDVRIDKTFTWKRWKLGIYLDLQNVYNQPNAEFLVYGGRQLYQVGPVRGIPFFPNLGMRVDF